MRTICQSNHHLALHIQEEVSVCRIIYCTIMFIINIKAKPKWHFRTCFCKLLFKKKKLAANEKPHHISNNSNVQIKTAMLDTTGDDYFVPFNE